MTIFGLDSAGKTAGVAILRDGALLYECMLNTGLTHSETLAPLCEAAFRAAGLAPQDVDVFAAAAGPGSFTGLRIGLAIVKGMALPGGTPCAAVSTLEALALSAPAPGRILAAIDARRGEVCWAAFRIRADGSAERLCPDSRAAAARLRPFVESAEGPVTLVGDGAALVYEALAGHPRARLAPADVRLGRAGGVCRAAWYGKTTVPPARLCPDYQRLSQAERERAERRGAGDCL